MKQEINLDERLIPVISSTAPDDICRTLGVKRTKAGELIKEPDFPKPVYLGSTSPRYFKSEVMAWLRQKREEQLNEGGKNEG